MNVDLLDESFGTLSETINGLIKLGYNHDFNISDDCLVCHQPKLTLSPNDFQIDKLYRFEGASNPDDQSILYVISSPKFGVKGVLVNGYGISADEATSKIIEKLEIHHTQIAEGNKSNEATSLRPEGDRVLNAELVEMNLDHFIEQIKNEITWKESDRNSITIFKSPTMRIVLLGMRANAELKSHKANGVISVQVLEGKIDFATESLRSRLEKGHMIALQENIMHQVTAITDSFFLLTLAMNAK